MWIIIKGQKLGQLVVCDNLALKQLFKAEKTIRSSDNLCINPKKLYICLMGSLKLLKNFRFIVFATCISFGNPNNDIRAFIR
jgi:hypothetical protein